MSTPTATAAEPPVVEDPRTPLPDRRAAVLVMAPVGIVLAVMALAAWAQWVVSPDEFGKVPILGPDVLSDWRLVALRTIEALSVLTMIQLTWYVIVRPLRRTGKLGLDAKIFVGCLLGCVSDGFLNGQEYLFAFNQNSINLGSWSSFMPFASSDHASRYAEALVWGTPMYAYYCIGVAIVGVAVVNRLRERRPQISNPAALGVVFVAALAFDFVTENLIIRLSHGYSFAQTPGSLTFWSGSQYQFPIYESIFVATLGAYFTYLRLSGQDSPDGRSWAERGLARVPPALRGPAGWFAVIGASMAALILIYHLGFNWLGLTGDSSADLPSYMLPTG